MVLLTVTVVLGAVGASAAGLGGTPGVFTADECHLEPSGRGGKSTSCSGVFVAHDGILVDRQAQMVWPGGRAGSRTRARTLLLGGYQREHGVDVAVLAVLALVMGLLSAGCAFAGLSRTTQDRLAVRLPDPAFTAYVTWRS
ncbi:hypothetical protein ACIRPX_15855 [Streptomyces sp. NPDC101225]|uniref:hypothetical protein n=1 Tax=Streptomyces sp. NPDC101225 TaxID=3366135 RepID=UPI0038286FA2